MARRPNCQRLVQYKRHKNTFRILHINTHILHTFKMSNILKFKIIEINLASKDTLKNQNKYNYCTKIQITKTTLHKLPHPHAHTPAQTQNTQSSPPHTDPLPTMQVDENQNISKDSHC